MRLPLKAQIHKILKEITYKAFGFKGLQIPLNQISLLYNGNNPYYKISLPQLVYEQYRKDDFKYADQGMTPRNIAEDILVHYQSGSHIDMEIDQWGNFNPYVKNKYFEDYITSMLQRKSLQFSECQQFKKFKQMRQSQQKMQKLFIYDQLNEKQSLSRFRQKYILNMVERVSSRIQNYHCQTQYTKSHHSQLFNFDQYRTQNNISIYSTCLKHETINKEIQLKKLFNIQNINDLKLTLFQFGIVFPQQQLYPIEKLKYQRKIKQMFLQYPNQYPINTQNHVVKPLQYNQRQNRLKINQIILQLEECLTNNNFQGVNQLRKICGLKKTQLEKSNAQLNNTQKKQLQFLKIVQKNLQILLFD